MSLHRHEIIRQTAENRPQNKKNDIDPLMVDCPTVWGAIERFAISQGWHLDEHEGMTAILARVLGVDERRVKAISEQKRITFTLADHMICRLDVWLWVDDPDLREVYESVDLFWDTPEGRSLWREQSKRAADARKAARIKQATARRNEQRRIQFEERVAALRERGGAVPA